MKTKSSIALLVCLLISSCGSDNKNEPSSSSSTIETYDTPKELQEIIAAQKVECGEEAKDCAPFAARLVFWGKRKERYFLGSCSGSLYKNKYIITNAHCIPDELKADGVDCSKNLKVFFPETKSYPAQSVMCSKIIQVYNEDEGQPDLAVFSLKSSIDRTSVSIAKSAFQEDSAVYAYTMNPSTSALGIITKKTCTLSIENLLLPRGDVLDSEALLYGNNCHIISGNSGSGLINSSGHLIGAINATMDTQSLDQTLIARGLNSKLSEYIGVVQNITCLREIDSSSGLECSGDSPTSADLDYFIKKSAHDQGFGGIPENELEYELVRGLKLKITKPTTVNPSKSLASLRSIWLRFVKAEVFSRNILTEKKFISF